jgi:hypothetical protein
MAFKKKMTVAAAPKMTLDGSRDIAGIAALLSSLTSGLHLQVSTLLLQKSPVLQLQRTSPSAFKHLFISNPQDLLVFPSASTSTEHPVMILEM